MSLTREKVEELMSQECNQNCQACEIIIDLCKNCGDLHECKTCPQVCGRIYEYLQKRK